MIIYEVNLSIDHEIYADFNQWLGSHIKLMLEFPGFLQAELARENVQALAKKNITVRYYLKDKKSLENYLTNHAGKMRDDGLNRFGDKFNVSRRIFENPETLLANSAT